MPKILIIIIGLTIIPKTLVLHSQSIEVLRNEIIKKDSVPLFFNYTDSTIAYCKIVLNNNIDTIHFQKNHNESFSFLKFKHDGTFNVFFFNYDKDNNMISKSKETIVVKSRNSDTCGKIIGPIIGAIIAVIIFILNNYLQLFFTNKEKLRTYKITINYFINDIIERKLLPKDVIVQEYLFFPNDGIFLFALNKKRIRTRIRSILELIYKYRNNNIKQSAFIDELTNLKFRVI